MLGLAAVLAATPVAGQPAVGGCVREQSGIGPFPSCTSNAVRITDIVPGSLVILDDGCTDTDDTVTFIAQGMFELTAQERFDIGIFIATDGDLGEPVPTGARTGQCGEIRDGAEPALCESRRGSVRRHRPGACVRG